MINRGAVVEYPSIFDFENNPRPYLILSDKGHPFAGDEYISVAITTTGHDDSVPIDESDWVTGGLPKPSFVKPWQPVLLKHEQVVDAFGMLTQRFADNVAINIAALIGAEDR